MALERLFCMRWLPDWKRFLGMSFSRGRASSYKFLDIIRAEYKFYGDYAAEGATVFDVGANTGEVMALLSKLCGPSGRVFCFEPVVPPSSHHFLPELELYQDPCAPSPRM
jgi:hypothetical protein